MSFTFAPARRDKISLLIALAGASGSGKTLSALRIARGLTHGDDSKIAMIDTEAGRGLHYAIAAGETPGPFNFEFAHGDLKPPFTPEAYALAIIEADRRGYEVIVVDSASHEYEGEGGIHAIHDALLAKTVERAREIAQQKGWDFNEQMARERGNIGAWNEPKSRHKKFVNQLLQCRAHVIVCMRAEEKLRLEKVKDGGKEKTIIIQAKDMPANERWQPICEKRFMYEMTLSFTLSPAKPGFPIPIKLQEQHKDAVPLDQPLSEKTGQLLAQWASGSSFGAATAQAASQVSAAASISTEPTDAAEGAAAQVEELEPSQILKNWENALAEAAGEGEAALEDVLKDVRSNWKDIPGSIRETMIAMINNRFKPMAAQVDQMRADPEPQELMPPI